MTQIFVKRHADELHPAGDSQLERVTSRDMNEVRRSVSSAVRVEMARNSLRQADLAEALGLSQQAVSRRLKGLVSFDADELVTLASLFGVSASALIDPHQAVPS